MNLGLPLEYKKLPLFFDAHNLSDETDTKNSVMEKFLQHHKVKSVLDLTCGTGSQVFFLKNLNYNVIGSDFSPALLKIARKKAHQTNLKIDFIDGDMRKLKLGEFDACITMFNAIGHLNKNDFTKTIKNIHRNLKNNGIYIFDIFNLEAINEENIHNFTMQTSKIIDKTQILQSQISTINKAKGLLTSYDNYISQTQNNKPKIFNNKFSLQIYKAEEIKKVLIKNGFKNVEFYALDGSKFIKNKSMNILTIAQK